MINSIKPHLNEAVNRLMVFYFKWIVVAAVTLYIFSGVYSVDRNETAIVQRFGKIIQSNIQPGSHYALPWPVDKTVKTKVRQIKTVVIDDFDANSKAQGSRGAEYVRSTSLEPYCISGDNNIINVVILLKYNIVDPVNFIFRCSAGEKLMQSLAASIVMKKMAELSVNEILTYGKKKIESSVKVDLQKALDEFDTGIGLSFVEIKKITPPLDIQTEFDDVVNAKLKKKNAIHTAEAHYNSVIPKARATANRLIQEAVSYKQTQILKAEGEVSRFLARLSEYKKSKKISKRQIHLDFIEEVFPKLKDVRIISDNGTTNSLPVKSGTPTNLFKLN